MMRRRRETRRKLISQAAVFVVLGLFSSRAAAQEQRISVVVEYVAGATLYIDAGSEEGITGEDTLYVYEQSAGSLLGAFRVMSVSRGRSVVTFAGQPFPITRGDVLEISFVVGSLPEDARLGEGELPGAEQRQGPLRPPLQIDGRLSFNVNALESTTGGRAVGLEPTQRTYTTPAALLRLTAANLPGGLTFQTNLRSAVRYSSAELTQPKESYRIYQLSLEKDFQTFPLFVRVGRFYNPFEKYSGYWDGLLLRVGGAFGLGFAAGFHPDRLNEEFSNELTKYSGFLNYNYRDWLLGYRADASVHHIRTRSGLLNSTYVGLSQRLRVGGWRASQDLQADRNPISGKWKISRLLLSTSVSLHRSFEVYALYSLRRPSALTPLDSLISERREQGGLGLILRPWGGSVSGDVTATRLGSGLTSYTYSSYFNFPRTSLLAFGFSGSASYWTQKSATTLFLSGGVSRFFGRTQVRALYHRYATVTLESELVTHGGDLSLSVPLARRLFTTLQAAAQRSRNLSSNSLNALIWMSF